MSQYPHVLYQPPAGRPRWTNDEHPECELQYLSWGWRNYRRDPIPVSRHLGWTYQLVVSGRAVLNAAGTPHVLRSGSLAIIAPSCPNGWSASSPKERCRILNWTWREPPLFSGLRPDKSGFKVLLATAEVAREIEKLHTESRNETRFPDEAALAALHALRVRLDVLLIRLQERPATSRSARSKARSALAWLEQHPGEMRPAAALSDHFQISPATLNRLFRSELKKSPRDVAYAVRMKAARRLLKESSISIKELAFQLGYSHPNDLTRAYTKYWKQTPLQNRR